MGIRWTPGTSPKARFSKRAGLFGIVLVCTIALPAWSEWKDGARPAELSVLSEATKVSHFRFVQSGDHEIINWHRYELKGTLNAINARLEPLANPKESFEIPNGYFIQTYSGRRIELLPGRYLRGRRSSSVKGWITIELWYVEQPSLIDRIIGHLDPQWLEHRYRGDVYDPSWVSDDSFRHEGTSERS